MAGKIITAWFSVTVLMWLLWFGAELYFSRQTYGATETRMTARKVLVELLQAKLAENAFERNGVWYENFYRTRDCPELARERAALASLREHALSLEALASDAERGTADQILALVERYARGSSMLVGAYLERGFKDVGKDAELHKAGRVLKRALREEGNRILSSDALELDTAEGLYRVRAGEDEAQDVFSKIERLKRDSGPDAQDLQRAIGGYQKAFEEFSIAQRRIGATDFDGIHGELRNMAVELTRLVEGAVGRAALMAEQAHARFVTVTAIAMVPTFALGAVLFLGFARTLNRRIRLLLEATGRVRQGDLTTPIASARGVGFAKGNIGDELTVLIDGFNEMMSQIATRDRALEEGHNQLAERVLQLQRTEGQLREALQRATESDRLKSAFLTNMSHEVRTPLNIILGYNSLIAERLAELHDNDLDPHLEAVSSASLRLISTIQGVMDLSRLETEAFEVRREPVNLIPLVEAAVGQFGQPAAQKQLSLTCKIEVSEAVALVDEYCLKEAIRLLLDNAIKFTERGDVTVRLYRAPNGIVVLTIRDTGIGIAPNYLPRLFEPFSQERVDSTRPFEGPGIGLALVKRYLDRCEAEISVQSEKGKGTAFTIRLPATAERSPFRATVPTSEV